MSDVRTLTSEIIGRVIGKITPDKALAFIIAVAAFGFFFDSFGISIVSHALPVIKQEFALNPKQLGVIGSAALADMWVGSWFWASVAWCRSVWRVRFVALARVVQRPAK